MKIAGTKHRLPKAVLGLLLVLVVLDTIALGLSRAALRRAEARIESEGSSLDPRVVFPVLEPSVENAREALEAAREVFRADDRTLYRTLHYRLQREILKGGAAVTLEDLELFRRAVAHYGPVLDILDAAFPIATMRFDFDREAPTFEQLPFLNATENFADLLCARAHLALSALARRADEPSDGGSL